MVKPWIIIDKAIYYSFSLDYFSKLNWCNFFCWFWQSQQSKSIFYAKEIKSRVIVIPISPFIIKKNFEEISGCSWLLSINLNIFFVCKCKEVVNFNWKCQKKEIHFPCVASIFSRYFTLLWQMKSFQTTSIKIRWMNLLCDQRDHYINILFNIVLNKWKTCTYNKWDKFMNYKTPRKMNMCNNS